MVLELLLITRVVEYLFSSIKVLLKNVTTGLISSIQVDRESLASSEAWSDDEVNYLHNSDEIVGNGKKRNGKIFFISLSRLIQYQRHLAHRPMMR